MQMCKTVTLRTRELKNDMLSFYLDYYPGFRDPETMKVTRHEALGIYIYAHPKNTRERTFNDSMTEKAEAIRCRRYESIVNDRYDFLDKVYIYLFLFATLPPPFIKYNLSQYTILTASIYYIHVHNILYCI